MAHWRGYWEYKLCETSQFIRKQDGPTHEMTVATTVSEEQLFLEINPNSNTPLGLSYLPTASDDSYIFETKVGASHTREETADWLES